jgi:leucyl aminopeptidase (aminopeptidase T)
MPYSEVLARAALDTLNVKAGDIIWIWASTHSLDLIEELALGIRLRGAYWSLKLVTESLLERVCREAPDEYLGQIPHHELRWLKDMTAVIEIQDHGGQVRGADPLRRRRMAAEWIALINETSRSGKPRIQVTNPTPALAAYYGISHDALTEAIASAVAVDHRLLDGAVDAVRARLDGHSEVQIQSPLGHDLRLSYKGRPVYTDKTNLPRGEVYVAPVESSAHGTITIDHAFLQGKDAGRLELGFDDGRLSRITGSESSVSLLQALLASARGEKDVIAEFAIGLNPGVTKLTGLVSLDEKMLGSVHIAVGMNKNFGGMNESNLHLDFVVPGQTVLLDGEALIVHGRLKTGT